MVQNIPGNELEKHQQFHLQGYPKSGGGGGGGLGLAAEFHYCIKKAQKIHKACGLSCQGAIFYF